MGFLLSFSLLILESSCFLSLTPTPDPLQQVRQGEKTRDKNKCKTTITTVKRDLGVRIKEMGHKGFRNRN